jgi:hypothetical protein
MDRTKSFGLLGGLSATLLLWVAIRYWIVQLLLTP